jgi:hypothetical protein
MELSPRGAKGDRGERGHRGSKGDKGDKGGGTDVTIVSWQVEAPRYRASPLLSNGTVGAMLELRPLFERQQFEAS